MVLLTAEIDMKLVLTLDKRRIRQSEVGSCEREREREICNGIVFVLGVFGSTWVAKNMGECEEHGWTFHIM